jgi:hypothetical protein
MTAPSATVTSVLTVTKKEFLKYLKRDFNRCYHCGITGDTLVPQHRLGRGMGGSKARDVPSNIITFCSYYNGLIEQDSSERLRALKLGWSLKSWQDPKTTPVFCMVTGEWYVLADDYTRRVYDANITK